jgi:hypothetical protein
MVRSERTLRALSNLQPTVKSEEARDSHNQRGERLDPVVRWQRPPSTEEIWAIPTTPPSSCGHVRLIPGCPVPP